MSDDPEPKTTLNPLNTFVNACVKSGRGYAAVCGALSAWSLFLLISSGLMPSPYDHWGAIDSFVTMIVGAVLWMSLIIRKEWK